MPALSLIASTFALVFLAELPDKTALASLVLATRFRARDVVAGAWLAFLVQTAVAVAAGSVLTLLPQRPIHILSGLGFFVFAVLALRRNETEELQAEEDATSRFSRGVPPWLTSFSVVFAAEWGDLTQLATAALVARTGAPVPVSIGAILALWSVTILAVIAGSRLTRIVSPATLTRASGVMFAIVGAVLIVTAIR